MHRIVCKFRSYGLMKNAPGDTAVVQAHPVTGEGGAENESYAAATPSGSLQLYVTNPTALPFFEEPGEFYVTISREKPV